MQEEAVISVCCGGEGATAAVPVGRNHVQCSAAGKGKLEVLQWLRAQEPTCPWDNITCEEAARNGHLGMLQWLRAQEPPCPWDGGTRRGAANAVLLRWAIAHGCPEVEQDMWRDEAYYWD